MINKKMTVLEVKIDRQAEAIFMQYYESLRRMVSDTDKLRKV